MQQKSRGTKDQLLIDKTMLRNCRKRHTNLEMAWIDYKKAYDMVLHSWILGSIELVQASDNILEFVKRSMANKQSLPQAEKIWQKLTSGEGFFRKIDYHLCYLGYA